MKRTLILFLTATLTLALISNAHAQSIYLAYGDREITIDEKKLENYLDHVASKMEEAVEQIEKSLERLKKRQKNLKRR